MPILTEHLIETHRTPAGGWNRLQLEALGVGWPPKKGWKDQLIGQPISEENLQAFIKAATAGSRVGQAGQETLSLFGERSEQSTAIDGARVDGATVCESDFEVIIYTDGACQGNPGIGGWGAVLRKGGHQKTLCGGAIQTTKNRMEITAAIMALQALTRSCRVLVYSDSQYVIQGMSRWLRGWKANQWRGSDGSSVKNQDLWMQLDDCASRHQVQWMWVRGHAGHAGNEQADALANQGAQQALEQSRRPNPLSDPVWVDRRGDVASPSCEGQNTFLEYKTEDRIKSTFLDLLRDDSNVPASPVEHGEGDLVRYCFRCRGQCAMGIVWREGWSDNDNEYVLLATWIDEIRQEHRASWVIYGGWEIGDLFRTGEKLEAGLNSPNKIHGLRISARGGCEALVLFVSSLQSPMCGLRFETNQDHFCALDGHVHPGNARVLMPKEAIYALLELIQSNPLVGDNDRSRAFMRCDSKRAPWVEHRSRWHNIVKSPLNDKLVDWLGCLPTSIDCR